ncbi:MAG: ABC transporter ATP-binding protein [Alphaproteobacteria bacterium]|nr:ABC transporter ATP-binding protein [Alphaproteobacteria bacterium]
MGLLEVAARRRPEPIVLDNLALGYDRRPAVHLVSGQFEPGSLTAVVGPNGAGKTTLIKGMVGLLQPLDGRIDLGAASRHSIAHLPQISDIDRDFPITCGEFVALGHWHRIGFFKAIDARYQQAVIDALDAVGLSDHSGVSLGKLSAGQLQRVLFARTMVQDCSTILLDEPFAAIDPNTTADLMAIIRRWHREGRTVVAVLHDLELVRAQFPRTLLLARAPVAWADTASALTPANLNRTATPTANGQWPPSHGQNGTRVC